MIVVTGGIACGKSAFVEVARRLGFRVVDADDWYKQQFAMIADNYSWKLFDLPACELGTVAFCHRLWPVFQRIVDLEFTNDFNKLVSSGTKVDFVVIPDYFNRSVEVDSPVVTIERADNLKAALTRDTSRDTALTSRIHKAQMPAEDRIWLANDVLYNVATSKEDFEKDCEIWLTTRLQTLKREK